MTLISAEPQTPAEPLARILPLSRINTPFKVGSNLIPMRILRTLFSTMVQSWSFSRVKSKMI